MMRTTTHIVPLTVKSQLFRTGAQMIMVSWPLKTCCLCSRKNTKRNLLLGFERPITPSSDDSSPRNDPPEFISRPKDMSDDEDYSQQAPRKKGGYDSRLEQILCENQDLQILITDAGKSNESGGSYIAYTIRIGVGLT